MLTRNFPISSTPVATGSTIAYREKQVSNYKQFLCRLVDEFTGLCLFDVQLESAEVAAWQM